jgi:hypothetical protein
MMGPELAPILGLGSRLLGTPKAQQRVEIAQSIQEVLEFEEGAEDRDLRSRLRREMPVWAASKVIVPRAIDDLFDCSELLRPRHHESADSEATREAVRSILEGQYRVLISADRSQRWWVENVYVFRLAQLRRARRRAGQLQGARGRPRRV